MHRIALSPLLVGALGLAFAGCVEPESPSYTAGLSMPPAPPPSEYAQPAPPPPQYAQPAPSVAEPPPPANEAQLSLFYDDLSPYGRWVVVAQYGWVFVPAGLGPDWRPYTVGRWEYTDYGWTWVSDEPFGWATCHYGGWVTVPQYGWAWVPGTQWGPAWVAWRQGEGYVGWAPLPPHHGLDITVGIVNEIPPTHYAFVDDRFVTAPEIRQHVVNVQQNTTIINKTTNITNIKVVNNRVVNNSLDVQHVERVTGKRIEPKVIRPVERPTKTGVRGNAVEVYRPHGPVAEPPAAQPKTQAPPPARTAPPAAQPKAPAPRTAPPAAQPQTPAPRTAPPAAKAPPPAAEHAGSPANNKAYEAERSRLAKEHLQQRQQLEQRQLTERQNRPANLSAAEQQRQHEAQIKALEERQHKELQALQNKHNQPAK